MLQVLSGQSCKNYSKYSTPVSNLFNQISNILVEVVLTARHSMEVDDNIDAICLGPSNSLFEICILTGWVWFTGVLVDIPVTNRDSDMVQTI